MPNGEPSRLYLNPTSTSVQVSVEMDRGVKSRPSYTRPLTAQAQEELLYASAGLMVFAVIPGCGLCLLSSVEENRLNDVAHDAIVTIPGGRRQGEVKDAGSLATAMSAANYELFDVFSPHMRHALGGIFGPGDSLFAAIDAARFAALRSFQRTRVDLKRAADYAEEVARSDKDEHRPRTAIGQVQASQLFLADAAHQRNPISQMLLSPHASSAAPGDGCFTPFEWSSREINLQRVEKACKAIKHRAVWYGKGKYIFHAFHIQSNDTADATAALGAAVAASAKSESGKAAAAAAAAAAAGVGPEADPEATADAPEGLPEPDKTVKPTAKAATSKTGSVGEEKAAEDKPHKDAPPSSPPSNKAQAPSSTAGAAAAAAAAAAAGKSCTTPTGVLPPGAAAAATEILTTVHTIMTGKAAPTTDAAVPTVAPRCVSAQETGPFGALRGVHDQLTADDLKHLPSHVDDWVHSHGLSRPAAAALARATLAEVRALCPHDTPAATVTALALPVLQKKLHALAAARVGKAWRFGTGSLGREESSQCAGLMWLPVASLLYETRNVDFSGPKTPEMYHTPPSPVLETVAPPTQMCLSEQNVVKFSMNRVQELTALGFERPLVPIMPVRSVTDPASGASNGVFKVGKPIQMGSFLVDLLSDVMLRAWLTDEVKRVTPDWVSPPHW